MIYTAGYHGHTAAELLAKATELNALVVDIRMTPWCQWSVDWRKVQMEKTFGDRYYHLGAWGNRNYKGGDIEIVAFEDGFARFRRRFLHLHVDNAILLCGCKEAAACHRSVIAALLRECGEEVKELDW
jgi:uncharacterized protein (DUF488 family)